MHGGGVICERTWRLTGFYGWAENNEKYKSWNLLRALQSDSNLPWLVVGDMNQILFEAEKEGGVAKSQREMTDFREALDDCGLHDLGFHGKPFTWWNKQAEDFAIFERLDRGVETMEWIEIVPHVGVIHMASDKSDHVPINITTLPRSGEA